jgi:RimJ/RimL family protein N-acetyltransferase
VPVRLRQEVQEVPRRLSRPEPALADDAILLEPLAEALAPELEWVLAGDPDIARFTRLPDSPEGDFLTTWLGRYEHAWNDDASAAGFAIRDAVTGRAIGFAGFVSLDLDKQQGEIGYVVAPEARGRGIATRTLDLLTRWGFDVLGVERIELQIDPANEPSVRVARRAGYRLEGTLRNTYFKEGRRGDVGIWARLAGE